MVVSQTGLAIIARMPELAYPDKWLTYSKESAIPKIRDLKIKFINGELKLAPDLSRIFNDELGVIKNNFTNDIISGSLALRIFGLIEKVSKDIDIILTDKDKYAPYIKDDIYYDNGTYLGYKTIRYKKGFFSTYKEFKVDFFLDSNVNYISVNIDGFDLKIHNLFDILDLKLQMSLNLIKESYKHKCDLIEILENLK